MLYYNVFLWKDIYVYSIEFKTVLRIVLQIFFILICNASPEFYAFLFC